MSDVDFDLTDDQLRAARTIKWSLPPAGTIAAWVAEIDARPCPEVIEGVLAAIDAGSLGYPQLDMTSGVPEATTAFLSERFGWSVDPASVVSCGDVMSGVGIALEHLCDPGPVVVPVPSYPPLLGIVPITGRELVTVPCTESDGRPVLDLEGIGAALSAGARTLLLTSPHNPLGRAFTRDELLALRDVANQYGARVISDEIHAPLVLPGAVHVPYASLPDTAHHTTTVVAASKAWNTPGLKSAQIVTGTPDDAELLRALPYLANHGLSPLGIAGTIAAYTRGGPWLDSLLVHLDRQRTLFADLMREHLPHLPHTNIAATYLVWVDVRPCNLEDPIAAAEKAGVAVSAGRDFGPGYEQFARVNIATSPERLERVVQGLARAWAQ